MALPWSILEKAALDQRYTLGQKVGCTFPLVQPLSQKAVKSRLQRPEQHNSFTQHQCDTQHAARNASVQQWRKLQGGQLSMTGKKAPLAALSAHAGGSHQVESESADEDSSSGECHFELQELVVKTFKLTTFRDDLRLTPQALERAGDIADNFGLAVEFGKDFGLETPEYMEFGAIAHAIVRFDGSASSRQRQEHRQRTCSCFGVGSTEVAGLASVSGSAKAASQRLRSHRMVADHSTQRRLIDWNCYGAECPMHDFEGFEARVLKQPERWTPLHASLVHVWELLKDSAAQLKKPGPQHDPEAAAKLQRAAPVLHLVHLSQPDPHADSAAQQALVDEWAAAIEALEEVEPPTRRCGILKQICLSKTHYGVAALLAVATLADTGAVRDVAAEALAAAAEAPSNICRQELARYSEQLVELLRRHGGTSRAMQRSLGRILTRLVASQRAAASFELASLARPVSAELRRRGFVGRLRTRSALAQLQADLTAAQEEARAQGNMPSLWVSLRLSSGGKSQAIKLGLAPSDNVKAVEVSMQLPRSCFKSAVSTAAQLLRERDRKQRLDEALEQQRPGLLGLPLHICEQLGAQLPCSSGS